MSFLGIGVKADALFEFFVEVEDGLKKSASMTDTMNIDGGIEAKASASLIRLFLGELVRAALALSSIARFCFTGCWSLSCRFWTVNRLTDTDTFITCSRPFAVQYFHPTPENSIESIC